MQSKFLIGLICLLSFSFMHHSSATLATGRSPNTLCPADYSNTETGAIATLANEFIAIEFFNTNPAAGVRFDNDSDGDPFNNPIAGWLVYRGKVLLVPGEYAKELENVSIALKGTENNTATFSVLLPDGHSTIDITWSLAVGSHRLIGELTIHRRSDDLVAVHLVLLRFNASQPDVLPDLLVRSDDTNHSLLTGSGGGSGGNGAGLWQILYAEETGFVSGHFVVETSADYFSLGYEYDNRDWEEIPSYLRECFIDFRTSDYDIDEEKITPGPETVTAKVCYYADLERSFDGFLDAYHDLRGRSTSGEVSPAEWELGLCLLGIVAIVRRRLYSKK